MDLELVNALWLIVLENTNRLLGWCNANLDIRNPGLPEKLLTVALLQTSSSYPRRRGNLSSCLVATRTHKLGGGSSTVRRSTWDAERGFVWYRGNSWRLVLNTTIYPHRKRAVVTAPSCSSVPEVWPTSRDYPQLSFLLLCLPQL